MRSVHEAIDAAHVIAFVSPLYFFSWTSQIKAVTDRLYPYCSPNSKVDISGRRAVLLAAAGDDDESVYGGMKLSFELMCGYCRWEIAGEILALGAGAAGEIANRGDWLERALNLGRGL
jgi:hypothetical protein